MQQPFTNPHSPKKADKLYFTSPKFKLKNTSKSIIDKPYNLNNISNDQDQNNNKAITINLNKWSFQCKNKNTDLHQKQNLIHNLINGNYKENAHLDEQMNQFTPTIDIKILNSIDKNEDDYIQQDEEEKQKKINNLFKQKQKSKKADQNQTEEIVKMEINKKIIQEIIYNKMKKANSVQNPNQANSLNSFKNIAGMFKQLDRVINYDQIKQRLNEFKSTPLKILGMKEYDKDLQRQQDNFDEICCGLVSQMKDLELQINEKKEIVKLKRMEFHNIQQQIDSIQDMINQQKNKYLTSNIEQSNFTYMNIKQQNKDSLKIIQDEINNTQISLQTLKNSYQQTRILYLDFLKTVFASEDILIMASLSTVLRQLYKLGVSNDSIQFPTYMDECSKAFIVKKANLEDILENTKKQMIKSNKQVDFEEFKADENKQKQFKKFLDSNGAQGIFEEKQENLKIELRKLKNHNRISQSQTMNCNMNKLKIQLIDYGQKGGRILLKEKDSQKNQGQSLVSLQEILTQISELNENEIERLRGQFEQGLNEQLVLDRLSKLIQSNFGAKKLDNIMNGILKSCKIDEINNGCNLRQNINLNLTNKNEKNFKNKLFK